MSLVEVLSASVTAVFLFIVISYYVLLLLPHKKRYEQASFSGITIIIPAHNESRYIDACLQSVLNARFPGDKQIIVVDDGSEDDTAEKVKKYPVTLMRQKHSGKALSINAALKKAKHDIFAIIDGDSEIHVDALEQMLGLLAHPEVAVVCPTVKVKNRRSFLGMWLHIEQLYNSLLRGLFTKTNTNIVAPGPLSVYKTRIVQDVGGFSHEGFSEDVDIAVRILRAGYRIEYASKSVTETNMPVDVKGFYRQRTRFARGWINIFKRHLRLNASFWKIYTLPLMLFGYLQAVVMGLVTLYNVSSGYWQYFASQGVYVSLEVGRFFFEWFSILGFINWTLGAIQGEVALTLGVIVGISSTLLTYPLYMLAILRFDRTVAWYHIIPLFFMFPFWSVVMLVYIINLPEAVRSAQYNIWQK